MTAAGAPVPVADIRRHIQQLEDALRKEPQIEVPIEHLFVPGVYARSVILQKGSVVVGKIHRHEHLIFLLQGEVVIATDQGRETIKAPRVWVSPAGVKRAVHALSDAVFTTIHANPTNTTDLDAIEEFTIAPTYEALLK